MLLMVSLLFLDGALDLLLVAETKTIHQKTDFYYGFVTTIKGIGMGLASVGAYQWLSKIKKDDIRVLYYLSLVKILFTFLMIYSIDGYTQICGIEAVNRNLFSSAPRCFSCAFKYDGLNDRCLILPYKQMGQGTQIVFLFAMKAIFPQSGLDEFGNIRRF